jgi:transposase InsO family protein
MVSLRELLYNGRKPFKEDIFMDNKQKNLSDAAAMAQFRLALIAPVIHGLYPDASRNAYYQRITENPLTLPDGSAFRYSPKTISKWVSLYQNGGIDALMPRERSDKGGTRVLTDTAIEEIYRLKEAFPRLNSTQIHRHLVEEAFIPASVSVCAVQRFVKKHDLKSARNPNMRDRKAFEEDAFGKMWQADTCYLPYITEDGLRRRVYCIMIIDDHSRFLVGGGLFYNDSAYNFQKVLKDAVAAHGIPSKLYVDNGSSYSNGQLSLICGSIGTVLLHTKIRDGASKAKIERQFRTLKETWLYTLDLDSLSSLAQFNGLLKDYMRSYNTSLHSGIGTTPLSRYQQTRASIRTPASREWLEECFLNRITRKVNKDSTVSIDKVSYDVPMQFISSKVEIRFLPDDMSSAFILYEGVHYPIRPTDKNENCRTKRNNTPGIDYSKLGGGC